MFFTINDAVISQEDIARYEDQRARFIIPDPPDSLIVIYEVNRLADLIGMRAEKMNSPEWAHEAASIPRNTQNPNFDRMMALLDGVRIAKGRIKSLQHLVEFLEDLALPRAKNANMRMLERYPTDQAKRLDVRFCDSVQSYMNYLYDRYFRDHII